MWQNTDSLPRRFQKEENINVSFPPRTIDAEELSSSPSVKKTVKYLNKLSSLNTTPESNFYRGRTKKKELRSSLSNVKTKGPYVSQIIIKEKPNES